MIEIEKANLNHLSSIMNIQKQVYPSSLIEDDYVFASIINQGYSMVAYKNNIIIGFLLAHKTKKDHMHRLHESLHNLDNLDNHDKHDKHDWFFIHDLSIDPSYHRQGIARLLFEKFEIDKNIQIIVVNNAEKFWHKMGFYDKLDVIIPDTIIQNYGGDKVTFMEKIQL